jgi:dipeptidyl aminopeptidase/acylaminoacyl peptidase
MLYSVNADGSDRKPLGVVGFNSAWSPDGARLAFDGFGDIAVIDAAGVVWLTNGNASFDPASPSGVSSSHNPTWSPDGGRIAFERDGEIYTVASSGTEVPVPLLPGTEPAWSPDGTRLALVRSDGIYLLDLSAPAAVPAVHLVGTSSADSEPAWSPDGSSLAFSSSRAGNSEIYVMRLDGGSVTRLTDNPAGDSQPRWSPDGTRLAFVSMQDVGGERIGQIFTMRADGADVTRLTTDESYFLDWGRLGTPTAALTLAPSTASIGDVVTLDASGSRDPDGSIISYEWDLDGDGIYETASGSTSYIYQTFASAGPRTVGVRVTDNDGDVSRTTATLTIIDRPPIAAFTIYHNPSSVGQRVTFNGSTSSDSDGRIVRYAWDLDGDGRFEETTVTPSIARTYRHAMTTVPRLRVTDDQGRQDTTTALGSARLAVLPKVLEGELRLPYRRTLRGIRVQESAVLDVPVGSHVEVTCVSRHQARCRRTLVQARSHTVAIRSLRRKRFGAGTVILVRVTKREYVGKYFRVRVRRGGSVWTEGCMRPGERTLRTQCS